MKHNKITKLANIINNENLDMDPEKIREVGYHAIDLMVDYLQDIKKSPLPSKKTFTQMKELMSEPLPEREQDPHDLLNECKEKIIENTIRIGHPRFLGWILPSSTIIGALADGIASTLNQNVAVSGAKIATATELLVIDWIKEILKYDSKAGGILVSGGTVANLTALTIARNVKADFDVSAKGMKQNKNMVLYASTEAHACIPKAANILGIGTDNIRWINVDDNLRLDIRDLEEKIIEDKQQDNHPFAVVATAGTVNTGAIDPLESIAEICQKHKLWFHVDAAYGGFAAISPNLKPLLQGINQADSVALDPHKWMFIPFEAGCLLVKNPSHMTHTFATSTPYIHSNTNKTSEEDSIDFFNHGIQFSREFRALKIWMSLKHHGIKKYQRIIDQNVHLTQYLEALIENSQDFEASSSVTLSTFCFRYYPEDLKNKHLRSSQSQQKKIEDYLNTLNRAIVASMKEDQRALLSSTVIQNKFVLRICIVNYRTTKQDIEDIVEIIKELGTEADKRLRNSFF